MHHCSVRDTWFESQPWTIVFIMTATMTYSLGHGLCTLTAVPKQPVPYSQLSLLPSVGW